MIPRNIPKIYVILKLFKIFLKIKIVFFVNVTPPLKKSD